MPGALLVGDSGGMVDTAALKGVHHCIQSGILAAEAIYASLKAGSTDLTAYEEAVEESTIGKELYQVRNARQAFQKGFIKGALLAGPSIMSKGKVPPGRQSWHRDDAGRDVHRQHQGRLSQAGRQVHVRQAVERLHHRQRHARRRAQPHPRPEERPARDRRDLGLHVPGRASTRSPTTRRRPGNVDVTVNYTNCVQCGAITAKGGRLTTPEGGDGPLYQIT